MNANLEADGLITVYDIETGTVIAQYEGLEVHAAMLEYRAAKKCLEKCDLGGIFDEFEDLPDAIYQMSSYLKDIERRNWL